MLEIREIGFDMIMCRPNAKGCAGRERRAEKQDTRERRRRERNKINSAGALIALAFANKHGILNKGE